MSPRHFRSQFILCPRGDLALDAWQKKAFGGFFVYAHPDLLLTHASSGDRELLLLGYAFDAFRTEYSNADLLKQWLKQESFESCNRSTFSSAGTFVLVYRSSDEFRMVHDAAGLREVYYTNRHDGLWIASQPALLERFLKLEPHKSNDAATFFESRHFADAGHVWAGDQTTFADVRHLRPNHSLDLLTGRTVRYWPVESLTETPIRDAVAEAARYLSGFVDAAANRYSLSLGISAGWDSRMLLAASRAHRERIAYFVIDYGRRRLSVDVRVARQLAAELELALIIRTFTSDVSAEYANAYHDSITLGRTAMMPLYYHVFLESEVAEMSLNGNVSEVARKYFARDSNITAQKLSFLEYGAESAFATRAYTSWLEEAAPLCATLGYDVLDLFYWEERMGNWGAKGRTEVHMSTDVFSPFNCRNLLALLLSVDERSRGTYDSALYRATIERMWPETLAVPFNPKVKHLFIRLMQWARIYPAYLSLKRAAVKLFSPLKARRRRD